MGGAEMFSATADAYDRFVGRYSAELAEALVAFAGLPDEGRALDVGCGPGALATVLADRFGPAGVCAVDPSASFAAACEARVPGIEVAVAGADALPFADGSFDATLSQLVVNFLPDARAGVLEMARVTRRGGTLAACVWDYAGEMTLLRTFWDAAREVEPDRARSADEALMPWCDQAGLGRLWRSAGLRDVRSAPLVIEARYSDFEDLWAPFPTGVGPAGAFCKSLSEDGRAALHDAYRSRLGVGDGPFALTARAWAVAGAVA